MQQLTLNIPGPSGTSIPISPPAGLPSALTGGLSSTGSKILQLGLEWLFLIATVLAVVVMLYSGMQWIQSGGDPGKIAAARARILYALIGLVVVLSAFFIVTSVLKIINLDPLSLFIKS